MSAALTKLTTAESAAVLTPVRRGPRKDEVRIAEYAPFPRSSAEHQPRIGFTRDVSALGMCLGVDAPEEVGALLRVDVKRLDGRSIGASVGRVVWCAPVQNGRFWLGLDLMCEPGGDTDSVTPEA